MKRVLAFICLLLIVALIVPLAQAQEPMTLSSVSVNLWPEYDDPRMLVIVHISLPSTVSLPTSVELRIPAAAGVPNAVAVRQPDGSLINTQYDSQVNGPWNSLNITATSPELQVEYYDPGLSKQGAERSFEYEWPGDYAVSNMSMEVQQPAGANGMSLPASFSAGSTSANGLVYYTANIGKLPAGQPLKVDLTYQKADDSLTLSNQEVQPAAPIKSSRTGMSSVLPWILGILGVALIVGALIWYWRTSGGFGQGHARARAAESHRRKPAVEKQAVVSESHAYCPQCGNRAAPGDRFCRVCGAELRSGQ